MLYIKSELVKVRIGRQVAGRDVELMTGDRYCHYGLVDVLGCVGDIWRAASARSSLGSHLLEFITICTSVGYDGVSIASDNIPTKKSAVEAMGEQ